MQFCELCDDVLPNSEHSLCPDCSQEAEDHGVRIVAPEPELIGADVSEVLAEILWGAR